MCTVRANAFLSSTYPRILSTVESFCIVDSYINTDDGLASASTTPALVELGVILILRSRVLKVFALLFFLIGCIDTE